MKIGRIFANAIARRIAYVVVALALAWLGFGEAKAQGAPPNPCGSLESGCTQPVAHSACRAFMSYRSTLERNKVTQDCVVSSIAFTAEVCRRPENNADYCSPGSNVVEFFLFSSGCPVGQSWNSFTSSCQASCAGRTAQTVSFNSMIPTGSVQCHNGCESVITPVGDGTYLRMPLQTDSAMCSVLPKDCSTYGPGYILNAATGMCQPPVVECAENEVKDPKTGQCSEGCPAGMFLDIGGVCKPKEDDCPAGQIRAPSGQCLPGDGQCAAGEVRRENGTCGRDADGDGEADEDDDDPDNDPKEHFSGGDN